MLTRTLAPGFASAGKPGYPNRQKPSRCGCVRGAVFLAAVSIAVAAAGHAQTFGMLYNFSGAADGANPGPLVQGPDGNFYGTNGGGGANGFGTVFKITPAGSLTTLHSFSGAEGSTASVSPIGGLALGNDGNFYGTTGSTFFRITPAGTLTTLYTFEAAAGEPQWLLLGADGNFYGTAAGGTSGIFGAVFKITPAGSFTNLFTFSPAGDNRRERAVGRAWRERRLRSCCWRIAGGMASLLGVIAIRPIPGNTNTPSSDLTDGRAVSVWVDN